MERATSAVRSGYEDDDPFHTVMFGYDRKEVDEYLIAVTEQVRVLTTTVTRLSQAEDDLVLAQAELERLRAELAAGLPSARASVTIQEMLRLAHREADDIRDQARAALAEASVEAERMRRAAREDGELAAASRRVELQATADEVLTSARQEADRLVEAARPGPVRVPAEPVGDRPAEPSGEPINGRRPGVGHGDEAEPERRDPGGDPAKRRKRTPAPSH